MRHGPCVPPGAHPPGSIPAPGPRTRRACADRPRPCTRLVHSSSSRAAPRPAPPSPPHTLRPTRPPRRAPTTPRRPAAGRGTPRDGRRASSRVAAPIHTPSRAATPPATGVPPTPVPRGLPGGRRSGTGMRAAECVRGRRPPPIDQYLSVAGAWSDSTQVLIDRSVPHVARWGARRSVGEDHPRRAACDSVGCGRPRGSAGRTAASQQPTRSSARPAAPRTGSSHPMRRVRRPRPRCDRTAGPGAGVGRGPACRAVPRRSLAAVVAREWKRWWPLPRVAGGPWAGLSPGSPEFAGPDLRKPEGRVNRSPGSPELGGSVPRDLRSPEAPSP